MISFLPFLFKGIIPLVVGFLMMSIPFLIKLMLTAFKQMPLSYIIHARSLGLNFIAYSASVLFPYTRLYLKKMILGLSVRLLSEGSLVFMLMGYTRSLDGFFTSGGLSFISIVSFDWLTRYSLAHKGVLLIIVFLYSLILIFLRMRSF